MIELENHAIYKGEVLYKEVDKFLRASGFKRKTGPVIGLFGDVLYENAKLK